MSAASDLRPLRRRLTAWYVGTYSVILLVLAVSLFFPITHAISSELDRFLQDSVNDVVRAARIRAASGVPALQAALAATDELETPDRPIYLFDAYGRSLEPEDLATPGIRNAALRAALFSEADTTLDTATQHWRVFGQRFALNDGPPFVALAAANTESVERQYRRVLEVFAAAGLAAIALVGAGGYQLTRVSTAPVEASFERMRRFVADAAHELRTPIALLRTQAEVTLRREREPAAYAAALAVIAREAEGLGQIADDLLTLARADAGERPVLRQQLYLDDVVVDRVAAAGALALSRNVQLELGRYEEVSMPGDTELLRRLVMILIDNAIQYTPAGGRVVVDVYPQEQRAVVVVQDTGSGIDPTVLPHIFERFFRGDHTRGRKGGAGLGLSIARWIADAHRAELTLQPVPEGGTIARFSAPRL